MSAFRRLSILALFACLLTSCTTEPPANSNRSVVAATPSPTASPSPVTAETTTPAQITLPLLDALLTDEKFVAKAKQNVKLTDQQIDSLKHASSAEIARLRESNA